MATIFHVALASEWDAARAAGAYTTSTLGLSLAEVGYIHASRADQWTDVRDRFYADVSKPLVLLHIDTDLLDVPVVEEPPIPGVEETFPHIYGRLPVAAVVKAIPLPPARTPTASTAAPPAATPHESFGTVYLREMLVNVGLLSLVIVAGVAGMLVGAVVDGTRGPGLGGIVGLAVGVTAAVSLNRRRRGAD